jgi:hypothetical protein
MTDLAIYFASLRADDLAALGWTEAELWAELE